MKPHWGEEGREHGSWGPDRSNPRAPSPLTFPLRRALELWVREQDDPSRSPNALLVTRLPKARSDFPCGSPTPREGSDSPPAPGLLPREWSPDCAPRGSRNRTPVPGGAHTQCLACAAPLLARQGRSRALGDHSPTPYFCRLVGIQRAMAATSPLGGCGCGGYSSWGAGHRRRAALLRAPGSSAMFR